MTEKFTPEQKAIAKEYEDRAFAALSDPERFAQIMNEFDEIQAKWKAEGRE